MGVNIAAPIFFRPDVIPAEHYKFQPRWMWFWNGSGSTIGYGKAVDLDLSVTTHGLATAVKIHGAESDDRGKVLGLCMRETVTGAWCPVQYQGFFGDATAAASATNGADVDGAVVAGDLLYGDIDAGTAGRLIPQSATYSAAHRVVAFAVEADTSNRARVILLNPLGLS